MDYTLNGDTAQIMNLDLNALAILSNALYLLQIDGRNLGGSAVQLDQMIDAVDNAWTALFKCCS